ncbi:chemotaxis protein MotB [Aquamicrobium terrae]
MSAVQDTEHRQEIIIVRRNRDDDDHGHHGGVWKIAFADFMTAMMCFFLVMWLINAANDKTKSALASYFNPVPLTDRDSSRKGLQDAGNDPSDADPSAHEAQRPAPKAGQDSSGNAGKAQDGNEKATPVKQAIGAEERLFADPYAVLAEIAAETGTMQNVSQRGEGGVQKAGPATGASGGESYRDPFAPDFWSQQMAEPLAEASAERAKIDGEPPKPDEKTAETSAPPVKAPQPAAAPALEHIPLEPLADDARTAPPAADAPAPAGKAASPAAQKAAAAIRAELAQSFKDDDKTGPGISVEATDKGVVISITDQFDFGMFEIGSALPSRALVLAMDKIGRIVNGQKGKLTIQGHTDARPFRSETYDNWRLSTARAHAAYYMLVRSGVDEHRIAEVAGFADRQPKDAADPLAAVNRRIEILLEAQ